MIGSGELKVNISIINIEEVFWFVFIVSGFDFSKVVGGNYFLDVFILFVEGKCLCENLLVGVIDVEVLDRKIVWLSYDLVVIGVCDLYSKI